MEERLKEVIGRNLKPVREIPGKSQDELAQELDISRATLICFENGHVAIGRPRSWARLPTSIELGQTGEALAKLWPAMPSARRVTIHSWALVWEMLRPLTPTIRAIHVAPGSTTPTTTTLRRGRRPAWLGLSPSSRRLSCFFVWPFAIGRIPFDLTPAGLAWAPPLDVAACSCTADGISTCISPPTPLGLQSSRRWPPPSLIDLHHLCKNALNAELAGPCTDLCNRGHLRKELRNLCPRQSASVMDSSSD